MLKNYLLFEEGCTLANVSEETQYHEVEKEETLREIAQRYYGDADFWEVIMRQNGLSDPSELTEGAVLEIPPL